MNAPRYLYVVTVHRPGRPLEVGCRTIELAFAELQRAALASRNPGSIVEIEPVALDLVAAPAPAEPVEGVPV